MTTRDTLEQLLEIHEEVERLEEMVRLMFNRIYAEHLQSNANQRIQHVESVEPTQRK